LLAGGFLRNQRFDLLACVAVGRWSHHEEHPAAHVHVINLPENTAELLKDTASANKLRIAEG